MTGKNLKASEGGMLAERPDFAANTGRGSEEIKTDDLLIPRIGLVQALSRERKKSDANYIEGAEEGMMFNSVTRELYREPLMVIPVYYRKEFILWKPRAEGGGFRGVYPNAEMAARAQMDLNEKTEIKDTAQQFVLVSPDNGKTWSEAVISMTGSNMPVSKKWNSDIRLKEVDRFAIVYWVSSAEKSNEKGDFYIFQVKWAGWATQEMYTAGEKTYAAIRSGAKDISRDDAVPDDAIAGEGGVGF